MPDANTPGQAISSNTLFYPLVSLLMTCVRSSRNEDIHEMERHPFLPTGDICVGTVYPDMVMFLKFLIINKRIYRGFRSLEFCPI